MVSNFVTEKNANDMTRQEFYLQALIQIAAAMTAERMRVNTGNTMEDDAAASASALTEWAEGRWPTKYGELFSATPATAEDEYTLKILFEDGSNTSTPIEASDIDSANEMALGVFQNSIEFGAKVWYCFCNDKLIGFGNMNKSK